MTSLNVCETVKVRLHDSSNAQIFVIQDSCANETCIQILNVRALHEHRRLFVRYSNHVIVPLFRMAFV